MTLRAPEKFVEKKLEEKNEKPPVDAGAVPKEEEKGVKSKKSKAGSRDSSPKPGKEDKKGSTKDEKVKPGKEGKKGEKSKKGKNKEQDDKATIENVPGEGEGISSVVGPAQDTVFTSGDSSSEKQRTVMASLVDGVIVCFFFAKDGTLSLQVNNPSGRTFELTSSGVVVFLPVDKVADEPPSNTAAPSTPPDVLSSDPSTPSRGGDKEREGDGSAEKSPRKGDKGEESKKKKGDGKDEISSKETEKPAKKKGKKEKGDSKAEKPSKDGEKGKKSKKKGQKDADISESEPEPEVKAQHVLTSDTETKLSSDLQFLNKVYEEEQGGKEISRCILPTGSVISYKENGEMKVYFDHTAENPMHESFYFLKLVSYLTPFSNELSLVVILVSISISGKPTFGTYALVSLSR